MANTQSYMQGFGGQITTLSQIQGNGLKLPEGFVDIRSPGKIQSLFLYNGNAARLYSLNRPDDYNLKNTLKTRLDYKNPNQGQAQKTTTKVGYAVDDATLVKNFLGTNQGFKFIGKQIILQGFQTFDETKIYNPASPLVAAIRMASFGALDRPVRHIDTSNIIGGVINSFGLGGVASTISKFAGFPPSQPPPPRSSVASTASNGLGLSTLTSLIGGGDRSNEVVAPTARGDVKGLLRGQTATNAYNSVRYSRLVSRSGNRLGFFGNLLNGVGKFIQNNTLIGGILPPKQPWPAFYRADEKTYDLYLKSGNLFSPNRSNIQSGFKLGQRLLSLVTLGLVKAPDNRVTQRFFNIEDRKFFSSIELDFPEGGTNRFISAFRKTLLIDTSKAKRGTYINFIGRKTADKNSEISPARLTDHKLNKYTNNIRIDPTTQTEYSDQLINYQYYTENNINNFDSNFSDKISPTVEKIDENLTKLLKSIGGQGSGIFNVGFDKYNVSNAYKNLRPLQFSRTNDNTIGMEYLKYVNPSEPNNEKTYLYRFTDRGDNTITGNKVPSRAGKDDAKHRFIRPTNNVDYVNALTVLSDEEFKNKYSQTPLGIFGPDIIKFYFYDIINKKYIPFNATIKSLSDNNTAEYETVEYLGRPDKLYHYKGFTRQISFNFSVVAHSVKELMPMWQRINYLTGLTRPANYTQRTRGFMVPPMVQLTMGDFYKNHNVVIESCNISIPDDALWETIPEDYKRDQWSYGPNESIKWTSENRLNSFTDTEKGNSIGRVAQFPRQADINISIKILEKDKPVTGRTLWGDAPYNVDSKKSTTRSYDKSSTDKWLSEETTESVVPNKFANPSLNTFSENIRTDVEILNNPDPVIIKPSVLNQAPVNLPSSLNPPLPLNLNLKQFPVPPAPNINTNSNSVTTTTLSNNNNAPARNVTEVPRFYEANERANLINGGNIIGSNPNEASNLPFSGVNEFNEGFPATFD